MKTVVIIGIVIAVSVVAVFVIGEIIWYFANEEFERARDDFKEGLVKPFEKEFDPISEQKESTSP